MLYKTISFVLLSLIFTSSNLCADQRLTFGAKLLGAGWNGDNGSGGSDFESDEGGQFALNISYQLDNFYTGLNLQGGEYDFNSNAPDKFTLAGRVATSNVRIKQRDFDLLVGYYFWPQVSLFADLKVVSNDWKNDPYTQNFVGLGLGTSGFIPLNPKWTLFGSFGFIGKGDIKDGSDNKVGEGKSWALEVRHGLHTE